MIKDTSDTNTLLNLNMHDTKQTITDKFEEGIAKLPTAAQDKAREQFLAQQKEYAGKIVNAFSDSLRGIFITSSIIMAGAAVLVFSLKEKELPQGKPGASPGVE